MVVVDNHLKEILDSTDAFNVFSVNMFRELQNVMRYGKSKLPLFEQKQSDFFFMFENEPSNETSDLDFSRMFNSFFDTAYYKKYANEGKITVKQTTVKQTGKEERESIMYQLSDLLFQVLLMEIGIDLSDSDMPKYTLFGEHLRVEYEADIESDFPKFPTASFSIDGLTYRPFFLQLKNVSSEVNEHERVMLYFLNTVNNYTDFLLYQEEKQQKEQKSEQTNELKDFLLEQEEDYKMLQRVQASESDLRRLTRVIDKNYLVKIQKLLKDYHVNLYSSPLRLRDHLIEYDSYFEFLKMNKDERPSEQLIEQLFEDIQKILDKRG